MPRELFDAVATKRRNTVTAGARHSPRIGTVRRYNVAGVDVMVATPNGEPVVLEMGATTAAGQ